MSKMNLWYKARRRRIILILYSHTLFFVFFCDFLCSHTLRCLGGAPCQQLCGTFVHLLHSLFFPSLRSFCLMISPATRQILVLKDAVLKCRMFAATAQIIVHLPTASLQLVQMGHAPSWLSATLVSTQAMETSGV
jgi:hypothetical protein